MSEDVKREWSSERAQDIESLLINTVSSVPGVKKAQGCSYDRVKDYKIVFDFEKGGHTVQGCFLEWSAVGFDITPGLPGLQAWTGGLSTFYPLQVIDAITRNFPRAYFFTLKGAGSDPWKRWIGITEQELRAITPR